MKTDGHEIEATSKQDDSPQRNTFFFPRGKEAVVDLIIFIRPIRPDVSSA